MPVAFIIGLIIFILIFLGIYFFQVRSMQGTTQETNKRMESEAAQPSGSTARPDEQVDPFKSAVPPKE
ncbi:MAG TPA: hypothetical protein VHT73_02080 [Thermodesulfobacteriota bacterium]|nr:hypothetical protein [Thermodesulfobacteriota bacterium]